MTKASDLREEAAACRDLAKCAVRLARPMLGDADRARLFRNAEELGVRAAALEKQAATLPLRADLASV